MVYIVYCRYEYWTKNGKEFTSWYKYSPNFDNLKEANEFLKESKQLIKQIDKCTKLKHEYEVKYIDETLLPQISLSRPKGRPKKIDISYLDEVIKKLNKSGKVKISEDVKCYLYNDTEAKEYIANHIKDNTKYTRYWYNDNQELFIFLKDKV